jgi:hypothetical protein|eukprot:COSAG06_NODE_1493_length_9279_cov_5.433878_5_plen_135_part_00
MHACFAGSSHRRTREAEVLAASSFCYPSLALATLADLRTARARYEQLLALRHAELTAVQEATGTRKELLELRVVFLGDKVKKVGPEHIDPQAVDDAYGAEDMEDIKAVCEKRLSFRAIFRLKAMCFYQDRLGPT